MIGLVTDNGESVADVAAASVQRACEDALELAASASARAGHPLAPAAVERTRTDLAMLACKLGRAIAGEAGPSSSEFLVAVCGLSILHDRPEIP